MNDFERALEEISPRAATVTILLFDRVLRRYEREKRTRVSPQERSTIMTVLRYIATRDNRAVNQVGESP